ncbi:MAG: hypothetical protein KGZ43_05890 [Sulfuritalea sp.]|nr:hypothetical protein [Sulfuritalea sp.]
MPYYIYRITQVGPIRRLEPLGRHDKFLSASAAAKALRKGIDPEKERIQVIFGANELQAEDAINTVRTPGPTLGADL